MSVYVGTVSKEEDEEKALVKLRKKYRKKSIKGKQVKNLQN